MSSPCADIFNKVSEKDGTLRLYLLIRVSQVRILYGLPAKSSEFANVFPNELFTTMKDPQLPSGTNRN